MPLAAMLIPLIPGLIQGVLSIVDAIRNSSETPDQLKAQLQTISVELQLVSKQVSAVVLPDA